MTHVVSANIQAGEHGKKLLEHIKELGNKCDIICLQEVHRCVSESSPNQAFPTKPGARKQPIQIKLYDEIVALLPDFDGYYAPQLHGYLHDLEKSEFPTQYGNALFVRKKLPVISYHSGIVYGKFNQPNTQTDGGSPSSKSMQVISVMTNDGPLTVAHFHGFWHQGGKNDYACRNEQSDKVLQMLHAHTSQLSPDEVNIILTGDFNYQSHLKCMQKLVRSKLFGKDGGIHLNKNIMDMRTEHYDTDKIGKPREASHMIISQSLSHLTFWIDRNVPTDHVELHLK